MIFWIFILFVVAFIGIAIGGVLDAIVNLVSFLWARRSRVLQGCAPSANGCLGARAQRQPGADSSVVASAEAIRREAEPLAACRTLEVFGHHHPVIKELDDGFYLVAHPNGPAIAHKNWDFLGSLAYGNEDVPDKIRSAAIWALQEWAARQPTWPKAGAEGVAAPTLAAQRQRASRGNDPS